MGTITSAAGLIVSGLGGHFMVRLEQEDKRLDSIYHREVFELYGLDLLLSHCDRLAEAIKLRADNRFSQLQRAVGTVVATDSSYDNQQRVIASHS